jgi:hypothetical protein
VLRLELAPKRNGQPNHDCASASSGRTMTEGSPAPKLRHASAGIASPNSNLSAIYALVALAVAGQLFINVYPVFLGTLAAAGRATPAQLGRIATVEYLLMALTAMFAGKLLPLTRLRRLAVIAALIQMTAVIATTWVSGNQLLLVRAIFASACGIHIWIKYEFVARSPKPGQLVGICTTVVVLVSMLMSWLGSTVVSRDFGVNGVIVFLGLPCLTAILGSSVLLDALSDVPASTQAVLPRRHVPISPGAWWLLASALTWTAGVSILWIYSGPLSKAIGISEFASRAFVVSSLAGSLAGAGFGAILAERLPAGSVLTVGLILCLAQIGSFLTGVSSTAYVIWFSVFGFLGYFLDPFFVKALVRADRSRQSVVFFPAAIYAGASLGPFIASFVVAPGQYRDGLLIDLGCAAVAICALGTGLSCGRVILKSSST